MKGHTLLWAAIIAATQAGAQTKTEDPVIMRVDGKDITRGEFEYSYRKNNTEHALDKKSLEEYVGLFTDFKLKVAEAEAMGLDTTAAFRKELKGYRDGQAQELLIDTAFIEREARRTYEETLRRIGPEGLVRTAHILLRIPQDAAPEEQQRIIARMDSIYGEIQKKPENFAEMARKFSEDTSARQGGELPWLFAAQVYPEFAREVYALETGGMSKPFLSPAGVHIAKMLEKKQFEPYEYYRESIHTFLERRGIRQKALEATADSLYKVYGGKIPRDKVLAHEDSLLEEKHPEFGYLMKEYHDGLLLFEASTRCVWDKAAKDEEGLERFFKKNRKKYTWDAPRFKGAVIHCTTPELAARMQKEMKRMPQEEWRNYVQKTINQDSLKLAYMERGLFRIGDNANVDSLAFGQGKGKPMEKYPYAVIVGKVQKKRPDSYKDVRGPLTADYQSELEREWVESLRKKYPVEIFPEVVESVNRKE